jgi:2,4-dienoyl-CoA reductase-like NADH-dependent reductase (Old Yellow Enzyme family)
MATLFEETSINGMTMRNRVVRSATWEGMCEQDGRPTKKLANLYRDLARGGVGLIITGFTFVQPEGKALPGKMGIHTDDFADDYKHLANAVQGSGGKIAVQLVHAGGKTKAKTIGRQPLAPSSIHDEQFAEMPAELTKDEISDIVTAFGEGARRAKAWGIDAVQLHGAHGYLINQFLSPHINRREDEYGGSIDDRSRFLLDVYQQVRDTVGANFPVLIKLTASDNLDHGLTIDDAVYIAKKLSDAGIDAIEVSSGTSASGDQNPARVKINKPEKEAYNLDLAIRMKEAVTCPVMVVGGFRSYDIAEKALHNKGMDYIAMSRPLIREPDLPNRWLNGDRSTAKCISCNSCFKPATKEGGIYCVIEKKEREKATKKGA